MLMRTDPFRELDRLSQQLSGIRGTPARPTVMPMDAWRHGDTFVVEFDLPGIDLNSIEVDVERNVITVKAERPDLDPHTEMIAAERSAGNWCWATAWTPKTSPPTTTAVHLPYGSRSPRRPSRARW